MRQPDDTQDKEPEIPPYDNPRRSRLEPFADLIREMREKRYPYRVIVERLRERGVAIRWQSIQKFCRVRGIVKGKRRSTPSAQDLRNQRIADRIAQRKKEKVTEKEFVYEDDGKPIRTWKDEV